MDFKALRYYKSLIAIAEIKQRLIKSGISKELINF